MKQLLCIVLITLSALGCKEKAKTPAEDAAEAEGIEIRYYSIIYDLVDDMKSVMSGLLAPERRETFLEEIDRHL